MSELEKTLIRLSAIEGHQGSQFDTQRNWPLRPGSGESEKVHRDGGRRQLLALKDGDKNARPFTQSPLSFDASSLEQIYVSLSRGNEGIRIYTDDLKEMRERGAHSTARGSAMDFAGDIPQERQSRSMPDIPVEMRRAWRAWERRKEKSAARSYEKEIHTSRGVSMEGKGRERGLELTTGR